MPYPTSGFTPRPGEPDLGPRFGRGGVARLLRGFLLSDFRLHPRYFGLHIRPQVGVAFLPFVALRRAFRRQGRRPGNRGRFLGFRLGPGPPAPHRPLHRSAFGGAQARVMNRAWERLRFPSASPAPA